MRRLGLAWCVWVAASTAFAESAPEILKKMGHAAKARHYEGLLMVHTPNQQTVSMKVLHKGADSLSPEQEKLVALDGDAQEVVIDGTGMLLYVPKDQEVQVVRNPFVDTFVRMSEGLDTYQLVLENTERVSGKQTYVIRITAKDNWRYSYKLWVDTDSYMYIRAQWFDHGKMVSDATVLNLTFHQQLQPFVAQTVPQTRLAQLEPLPGCVVKWLPEGFSLVRRSFYPPEGPGQTEHLIFSDGLAKISVYVDVSENQEPEDISLGRTNAYSMPLSGNRKVVVLGEAPLITMRKMAQSVVLK